MSLEIAIRCEKISNSVGIVNSDASVCGGSNNVTANIIVVRLTGSVMRLFQFDRIIITELNVSILKVFKFDKQKCIYSFEYQHFE